MNQPSRVSRCMSGVACGSAIVQVCQTFLGCRSAVPWNQVGVGGCQAGHPAVAEHGQHAQPEDREVLLGGPHAKP